MLLINELKLALDEDETKLKELINKRLHAKGISFTYKIHKIALDCRKEPLFSYSVLVDIPSEDRYLSHTGVTKYKKPDLRPKKVSADVRPIIIGYGPSGIFAAYRLLEAGFRPIVIEKGKRIKERSEDVERFFRDGILDENSNVQFGEGGAGTFSDAKLTTRIKDPFVEYILDVFVKHGANPNIRYKAHAHIGTDEIRKIIELMTNNMMARGAEFHFEEEVKDFVIGDNRLTKIITDKGEYVSDCFLLGVGHSAYPTIKVLYDKGVQMQAKDMAIGFRVEHPQNLIDYVQYNGYTSPKLEAAEYFLRYKDEKGVYSFCMCPGGIVVPATSDKNRVVTNGMSYSKRDSGIANSAILVQVEKSEYPEGVLGGFDYLKEFEEKAYQLSGSYKALSQNIRDYLNGEVHDLQFESSYSLGTVNYDLNGFFTAEQNRYLHKALEDFDRKIPGFIDRGIMVGPETRSSCPVRIERNSYFESVNTKGLYPMGEGAGYGGGIMSCALDGIRVANEIINSHK